MSGRRRGGNVPSRLCPRCGKPVPMGKPCPRCSAARAKAKPHGPARTPEQERRRNGSEPWRRHYGSAEYQRNRQRALDATGGCCAVSGARIADKVGGRWVMRPNGGVHHIVALSEGGTNDVSNLVPLDVRVHAQVEAERRRNDK